ncbi:MAG TPA: OadG family transporter subunit [Polyangiaceae bacterium]
MKSNSAFVFANSASGDLGVDWGILGVVLLGVAVLMVLVRLVGSLAVRSAESTLEKASASARAPDLGAAEVSVLDATLVAVISAAAAASLNGACRVVGIREVSAGNEEEQRAWAQEGRREVYMSHRLR